MNTRNNNRNSKNVRNTRNVKSTRNIRNTQKSNNKVTKIKPEFMSQNFIYVKKIQKIAIAFILILALLICRIGYLQFVKGSTLKELAYNQQSINQIISPKRGSIYDANGEELATSVSVDTVTINPALIKDSKNSSNTQALKEKVAKAFSDIFELDYNETLEKVTSTSQVETIAKKVDKDKVDKLKQWMKDNDFSSGINIDEDTKRYYPHNNVLAQVIGSCGSDNQGLSGLEVKWDDVLAGTPGKVVSSKDGGLNTKEIPNSEQSYIAAENGSNLTLTIDLRIQSIVEKYLKQVVDTNNVEHGGTCIAMNPKTGDILAMATYPDYNLNTPFTPNESLAKTYNSLSDEEKTSSIYKMWSNKAVSELYEPGSVFKLITASAALEENITDTDVAGDFYCHGYEKVEDRVINCWTTAHEGPETLRRALMNSCNPALIQLGARVGTSNLYKYYKLFGFFDKTDIDLPGEASSIFSKESDVGPVERATYSFGQRFSITPIQMISAVSAIANDGVLMKPRIVKSITNSDTGAVTNIDTEEVRQVISTETAAKMKSMMQSVVEGGSGWRGGVAGYSVGGKTGTAEPNPAHPEDGYTATFVAVAPIEDPQVVLLLNLYKPPQSNHQGGVLCGPVVSQMLSEILPTLGIPSNNSGNNEETITVPDVRNKTIAEAEKVLTSAGFTVKTFSTADKNSTIVKDQMPKPNASLTKGSIIVLYDQDSRTSVTVPDLTNKSQYQATTELRNSNLNISVEGTGTVVSQDPPKGSNVDAGTIVKVILRSK